MTASSAHDARHDDWAEMRATPVGYSTWVRVEPLVWTLASLVLVAAFVVFVVDDYTLRNLIAAQ
jgi:hypothetical protein